MVAPIERLTVEQFASLLAAVKATLTRKIHRRAPAPHLAAAAGRLPRPSTVEAMRRFHMGTTAGATSRST